MSKPKLSPQEIAEKWAFFTVSIWREKLHKYKIGRSGGPLYSSFQKNVTTAPDGSVMKINFAFKYYGKFVDMGVGKGTPIGGVNENRTSRKLEGKMLGNRRRPKKWYSKTFYAEVATLKEIMAREWAHKGTLVIRDAVENLADNSIKGGARVKL